MLVFLDFSERQKVCHDFFIDNPYEGGKDGERHGFREEAFDHPTDEECQEHPIESPEYHRKIESDTPG
jgi:hypothetical protein